MKPCDSTSERRAPRQRKDGYLLAYAPEHPSAVHGRVLEHRLIMEGIIGRRLLPEEVVHHIDGNPSNNAPENLLLLPSQSAHMKLHAEQRRRERDAA